MVDPYKGLGNINDFERMRKSLLSSTEAIRSAFISTDPMEKLREQLLTLNTPMMEAIKNVSKMSAHIQDVFAKTDLVPMVDSISHIQGVLNQALYNGAIPKLVPGQFLVNLPDLTPLITQLQEAAEKEAKGEKVLDDSGYSFLTATAVLSAFAEFARIDPCAITATVTNTLLRDLRSEDFRMELSNNMLASTMLKRRWPIVEKAILAHDRREYILSIPAMLAQVEGAIADALIVAGQVTKKKTPKGEKLYKSNGRGNLLLDKNGNPMELKGLDPLVKHSNWHNHDILYGIAGLATQSLAGKRNGILHGRDVSYGQAKLSVILLLVIDIVASEFASFERPLQRNAKIST